MRGPRPYIADVKANDDLLRAEFDRLGIRVTAQRLEMARILLQKPQHLTAEQVFAAVNRSFPQASRATVFNNLKLFAKKGLLRAVELKSGVTLYDSNNRGHHHVLDVRTGAILDAEVDPGVEKKLKAELLKAYADHMGVAPESAELQITLRVKSRGR